MQRLQNACLASANAFALGMKGLAVRDIAAEIQATAVPAGAIAPWWLDTVMYDGLVERLRDQEVDVLLAPINGRDYFRTNRNTIGNLSAREAADLAAAAGVRLLIPGHWDLFEHNAENPGHLFEYLARFHPEQRCHYMARGERFVYFPCG